MGGLSPFLSTLSTAFAGANSVVSSFSRFGQLAANPQEQAGRDLQAQQSLALKQLQAQQRLQETQAEQEAALARQKIAADAQAADETRRAALRRAVARQRAEFGASGTGSSGGSAQAVLLGLYGESDTERAQRERLDTLRTAALESGLAQARALNVLQRTQLRQKQALERELLSA